MLAISASVSPELVHSADAAVLGQAFAVVLLALWPGRTETASAEHQLKLIRLQIFAHMLGRNRPLTPLFSRPVRRDTSTLALAASARCVNNENPTAQTGTAVRVSSPRVLEHPFLVARLRCWRCQCTSLSRVKFHYSDKQDEDKISIGRNTITIALSRELRRASFLHASTRVRWVQNDQHSYADAKSLGSKIRRSSQTP